MKTETRALVALAVCGPALLAAAWLVPNAMPAGESTDAPSPVERLPMRASPAPVHAASAAASPPGKDVPRLLQTPTLSQTQIAFAYAGELWTVARAGGEAERLVTGQLRNRRPLFSPDGSQVAFTGVYDGNADVYVVPAAGGEPRRLTYYPGSDEAVGWTPDGTKILFSSQRDTARDLDKLFTVSTSGGFPEELPLPSGKSASYSPDGKRLAYVPFPQFEQAWKRYRGGQTTPIYIADLADSHITKIPRDNSNDAFPMWVGDAVYFLSDRHGTNELFAYDVSTAAVRDVAKDPDGFDIRSASAGPGGIVYEELTGIHLYDFATRTTHAVPVTVSADLPQVRARFEKVTAGQILHAAVSPTGKRVLFEARGEILSAPAEKGDIRNLTRTPGSADRDPAWSPDGKWVAWLSDEPGEYALYLRAPDGLGAVRKVDLGKPGSFFYSPRWSPDSKKIVLWDKRLQLWLVDLEHPTPVKIDTANYDEAWFDATWSPDSRFIAYKKELPNRLTAIFVYALGDKSVHQVTDGRSSSSSPRFDRNGKVLWFLASTDAGLAGVNGMVSMGRAVTSSVYGVVLTKDVPSPIAPESDEEAAGGAAKTAPGDVAIDKGSKDKTDSKPIPDMKIDFDALDQRIVALPVDRAKFVDLQVTDDALFLVAAPLAYADEDYLEYDDDNPPPFEVTRFDLKKRRVAKFIERLDDPSDTPTFSVSADGKKALYAKQKKWFLVSTDEKDAPAKASSKEGDGQVKIDSMEVWVDPRAEWRQIFHEVWRIERDFLYDPGAHGLDLAAAEKLYTPYLDGIAGRDDLNTLLQDALGYLVLGHTRARGGAVPKQDSVHVGLLGADYQIQDGRYRFARILAGENWNPKLRAPLTEPGVMVKPGDFLLAVNGEQLRSDDDVHRLFLGRAGKQTVITVGPSANGTGTRQVTVVPVASDGALRLRTWMEDCRKKVDELSGGRVGYVFIPDTHAGGFLNFNRYYFSQTGKDAVILDERFNHGGLIADYIINVLKWTPLMGAATREGLDDMVPSQGIFGPKVMLANQMSGSGGDALPWMFKNAGLGPLVGVRTWGGLVGIGNYPRLVDGGMVTAPRWGIYGTKGEWEVENHGVAPDVEVEQDPALMRAGHDPQLERGVAMAMEALAKNPPKKLVRPAYPNYGPRLPHPGEPTP